MRLAGTAKAGFYPLPEMMIPPILSTISRMNGERTSKILDPGCGEGVALTGIARGANLLPFGCELHEQRASYAADAVKVIENTTSASVINDDYRNIRTERKSFTVLYLNPPYDFDKESGREEYTWLKAMRPYLAEGGLLIWIVPERILGDRLVQRYLASWFTDLLAYRFVGDTYNAYKQVVIYGTVRKVALRADVTVTRNLRQLATLHADLPEHPTFVKPLFDLSYVEESKKFWFFGMSPNPEAVIAEVKGHGIETRPEYRTYLSPAPKIELDPLTPMKIGHIASTIAAGHINNKELMTDKGRILIKGSVYNEQVVAEISTSSTESTHKTKTVTVHDPRSVITTIDEKGEIGVLKNSSLASFLKDNIIKVTELLKELYPPRYMFKLGKWKKYLKGVNPRRIPNTNRTGLLPAQKHSAAAICQQWEEHDDAILVGQVGTGKTVISVSAAYAQWHKNNNRDHFIVMCPPHLVNKWIREVLATWPDSMAMGIYSVTDVDRFFRTQGPIFGIVKSTAASLGDGWTHRINYFGPMVLDYVDKKTKPYEIVKSSKLYDRMIEDYNESVEGTPERKKVAKQFSFSRITCPTCGKAVTVADRKHKDAFLPVQLSDFKNIKHSCRHCNTPLWQDERKTKGRYPIATYIKRHYRRMIDITIVDEAHQYKGDSDRGEAYARMVAASKKFLIMTGTIYGGKASTLFLLLYRLSAGFREHWTDFTASEKGRIMAKAWETEYGVTEYTSTESDDISSKSTGASRTRTTSREIPGSSPAMLPWLLNRSIFVSLKDMGIALPKFSEHVIEVEMDAQMKLQYDKLYSRLSEELSKRLIRGDRSLLGKYIASLMFWPDAPWRAKEVYLPNEEEPLVSIPGTGQPLGIAPKESQILELIKDEIDNGRNCLLVLGQTNTLDIQPQWKAFLAQHNIHAAILKGTPAKREAWIRKAEKDNVQVIISHPKKVETGLDILSYPTIIWMAPDFSIYTVIQASGRAYRLGQTNDCKVYHFAYTDTIQGQALKLIIAKAAAAKRVNGDTIESDDLADLDKLASSSIENELAKLMRSGVEQKAKMVQINLDYEMVSDGIFTGHFTDCESPTEAKKLFRELAKANHPDKGGQVDGETVKVESLQDLFERANKAFAEESAYTSEESITDDEDPEYVVEDQEPTPVDENTEELNGIKYTWTKARIVHTPAGVVAQVIEKPEVVEVVEVIDVEPNEPERLVFGKSKITVSKRKPAKVNAAQMSLF